jgi:5'-nucleotidase
VRPGGADGVSFHDEVETINALVPQIRAQGIEAIVVLVHEGGIQSGGLNECTDFKGEFKHMVERFDPAVDVVVSAHTHRFYICDFGGKLTTSAGSYGTLVTEIDLRLDRATRDIVARSGRNLVVRPDGPKDARLSAHVENYAKLAKPLENKVVAKVTRELPSVANAAGESLLGNLIADAQTVNINRAQVSELQISEAQFATSAPKAIAFNNPGSLRAPLIPALDGSVTYGELFKIQPFQNDMISMTMTGAQIKEALEQQFIGERVRIMGVSRGFSYTWDNARPRGDKVIAASIKLNGITIKPDEGYRVIANSFLAGGSDGFSTFLKGVDRRVGLLDVEVLVNYLSSLSPYSPPPIGERITRLN